MSASEQSNTDRPTAVRLGPQRFWSEVLRDAVTVTSAQQRALEKAALPSRDGGWILPGYVGQPTTDALRARALLTPHAYTLSAAGEEIRHLLLWERRARSRS